MSQCPLSFSGRPLVSRVVARFLWAGLERCTTLSPIPAQAPDLPVVTASSFSGWSDMGPLEG